MARFTFFNLGLISIFAQALLLRELQVSFYGNELFTGVILAFWLFSTGLGSYFGGRFLKRNRPSGLSDWTLGRAFFLEGLLVPFTLTLIRASEKFIFTFGELKNIFVAFGFSFLAIFPLCFILGVIFPLGLSRSTLSTSAAYLWETLGHGIAGILFSFFLVRLLDLRVALLISAVSFLSTFLIALRSSKHRTLKTGVFASIALAAIIMLILLPIFEKLNFITQKYRYPNLLGIKNSPYGQIATTKSGTQTEVYESGLLLGTTEGGIGFNERLIHLPFSAHPDPQRILLIGGGWNGALSEILKYKGVLGIDYVELDPTLISTVRRYLSSEHKKALEDQRVNLYFVDGRKFLNDSKTKYDVVIFNLPNPSTAMVNRFYTEECFLEVRRVLSENGVFATYLSTPTSYLSTEAQNLLASIYQTLKEVFPSISILPQEETLFIVKSAQKGLPSERPSGESFVQRFKQRSIKTHFLTTSEIEMRFSDPRGEEIRKLLGDNKTAKKNFDFHPAGYFYEGGFWQTMFSFKTAKVFASFSQINLLWAFVFLSVLALISSLFFRSKLQKKLPLLAVTFTGFGLMTFEMILILAFQTKFGYLYSKLALLMGLLLLGMGLGNMLVSQSTSHPELASGSNALARFRTKFGMTSRPRFLCSLKGVLFLIAGFFAFLPAVLVRFTVEPVYFLLTLLGGFLAGTVFPLAVNLRGGDERALGLYSADLFGSVLGAILPSLFLIPLWGIGTTSFLVAGTAVLISLLLLL